MIENTVSLQVIAKYNTGAISDGVMASHAGHLAYLGETNQIHSIVSKTCCIFINVLLDVILLKIFDFLYHTKKKKKKKMSLHLSCQIKFEILYFTLGVVG